MSRKQYRLLTFCLATLGVWVMLNLWVAHQSGGVIIQTSTEESSTLNTPQLRHQSKSQSKRIQHANTPFSRNQTNIHAHYPLDHQVCSLDGALQVSMHPAMLNFLDLTRNNRETEQKTNLTYTSVNHYDYRYNPQKLVQLQACLYYTLHQWREFAVLHNMTNWAAHGGTAMASMCHGAMNPWDDDVDITLDDCTTLNALWEEGQDVAEVYPDIARKEYHWEAPHQVFEGRLVTPNLILLKGSICCHWYKLKTVAQCQSGLRPEPADISGMDIECIRPTHLATTLPGEEEARRQAGWQDYDFTQGVDDVMFGPTKIQVMPQPILDKYITARYGKYDPCSFPFDNGQDKPVSAVPQDNDLLKEHLYLPIIRQYSLDFVMQTWYTSKQERDEWREQAGTNVQQELTDEIPNLNHVEIDNSISHGCQLINKNLNIIGFNAERGTHWSKIAKLIKHADVIILNEMDIGMARSGNMHTTRRLAFSLNMNYAFGVEFVELTTGTKEEQEAVGVMRNALGLHGNAILTKCHIGTDAMIVRDRLSADYFSSQATPVNANVYEIRLGGRMGLFARIYLQDGSHFVVGSVHKLAETDVNQAAVMKQYMNKTDPLGVVVQGDFPRSLCRWVGLENADNEHHFTWPASCEPTINFGTHRGDNICTDMKVVGEDRVISPCVQSKTNKTITLSDHAIVSIVLQTK